MKYNILDKKKEFIEILDETTRVLEKIQAQINPTRLSEILSTIEEIENKAREVFIHDDEFDGKLEMLLSETDKQKKFITSLKNKLENQENGVEDTDDEYGGVLMKHV